MSKRNTYDQDEALEQGFQLNHLKRLGTFLRPYRFNLIKILVTILFANVLTMMGPWLTQIAIDKAIPSGNMNLLIKLTLIFFTSLILIAICMRYRIYAITDLGQNILKDMRYTIFSHLQRLSFRYFDTRPHGKILIRVVNYINTLSDLLSNGFINLISDILSLIITLIFMFMMDPVLTLYSLALIPILGVATWLITTFQRKAYQYLSNKQSNMNAYIHESIAGIKVTQSFARESENFNIFQKLSREVRIKWMHAVKIMFSLGPVVQNVSALTMSLIYFVGLKKIGVDVSTGTLIAFIALTNNFWNPVINIGNFYNSLVTATAYMERIFETIDEEPEIKEQDDAYDLPTVKGEVTFKDVSFRYDKGERLILDHLNIEVGAGQRIALVGETGSGKTTIINLLSRFYDVTSGEILIDQHHINAVTITSLRKQMGVMLQDSFIFTGTIMENIRYGNLEATDEEVYQAAKIVRADDFIRELKDGYETQLEERGATLSAGQRQLISFARTLLSDPKILILDEATSSIDTKTEELLQIGLDSLLKGRTSFIIAHRLSTITNSDQILYIGDGNILEQGTHQELLALGGRYHQLYQSQLDLIKG